MVCPVIAVREDAGGGTVKYLYPTVGPPKKRGIKKFIYFLITKQIFTSMFYTVFALDTNILEHIFPLFVLCVNLFFSFFTVALFENGKLSGSEHAILQ